MLCNQQGEHWLEYGGGVKACEDLNVLAWRLDDSSAEPAQQAADEAAGNATAQQGPVRRKSVPKRGRQQASAADVTPAPAEQPAIDQMAGEASAAPAADGMQAAPQSQVLQTAESSSPALDTSVAAHAKQARLEHAPASTSAPDDPIDAGDVHPVEHGLQSEAPASRQRRTPAAAPCDASPAPATATEHPPPSSKRARTKTPKGAAFFGPSSSRAASARDGAAGSRSIAAELRAASGAPKASPATRRTSGSESMPASRPSPMPARQQTAFGAPNADLAAPDVDPEDLPLRRRVIKLTPKGEAAKMSRTLGRTPGMSTPLFDTGTLCAVIATPLIRNSSQQIVARSMSGCSQTALCVLNEIGVAGA